MKLLIIVLMFSLVGCGTFISPHKKAKRVKRVRTDEIQKCIHNFVDKQVKASVSSSICMKVFKR
jgi:DNA-binding transcriptional regulator YhcF (GntR family)